MTMIERIIVMSDPPTSPIRCIAAYHTTIYQLLSDDASTLNKFYTAGHHYKKGLRFLTKTLFQAPPPPHLHPSLSCTLCFVTFVALRRVLLVEFVAELGVVFGLRCVFYIIILLVGQPVLARSFQKVLISMLVLV